jgi:putative ABC transport system permease protein
MNFINLIRIAFKALMRNKLRAFLTMLGVIIGVAAVIAMVAIGQGSKQSIQTQLSGMGSNMITIRPNSNVTGGARLDATSVQSLTLTDVMALQNKSTYLSAVSPSATARGQVIYGNNNWSTSIQGVNTIYLDTIRQWPLTSGNEFTSSDVASEAKVCLLGQTVANNLFTNGENPVGKYIRFAKIPFLVIGVLSPKGANAFGQDQDDIVIAPYTTVQKRILSSIYFQNIYASSREGMTTEASSEISQIMRTSHRLKSSDDDDFAVRTMEELIKTFTSTSSLLTVLLAVIAGISLVVGGIGIMNIMYVSVTERTREIGLRMAIGATGVDILLQFLTEAIMISITGALIGVLLGITASMLVTYFLSWPTLITEFSIILSFMVCVATGVFFGYYPAQKASRLDPIEALRYE